MSTVTASKPTQSIKPTDDGGKLVPPPAGSFEERAETALAVGWPGAFGVTCGDIERFLKTCLFWET
jgi:hypothetical protein